MDFYKRMEIVCREIPAGCVASYGQIALLCGKPGNARQVGYALGHGRCSAGLPAHRIVNGKGILTGAPAFALEGLQRKFLEEEGVILEEDGHVDMKKFGWHPSLEDAIRLRGIFDSMGI